MIGIGAVIAAQAATVSALAASTAASAAARVATMGGNMRVRGAPMTMQADANSPEHPAPRCVDCAHFKSEFVLGDLYGKCLHRKSPVTGGPDPISASLMRGGGWECGPKGKLFTPKENAPSARAILLGAFGVIFALAIAITAIWLVAR